MKALRTAGGSGALIALVMTLAGCASGGSGSGGGLPDSVDVPRDAAPASGRTRIPCRCPGRRSAEVVAISIATTRSTCSASTWSSTISARSFTGTPPVQAPWPRRHTGTVHGSHGETPNLIGVLEATGHSLAQHCAAGLTHGLKAPKRCRPQRGRHLHQRLSRRPGGTATSHDHRP